MRALVGWQIQFVSRLQVVGIIKRIVVTDDAVDAKAARWVGVDFGKLDEALGSRVGAFATRKANEKLFSLGRQIGR